MNQLPNFQFTIVLLLISLIYQVGESVPVANITDIPVQQNGTLCSSDTCMNNGTCSLGEDGLEKCNCTSTGFEGPKCNDTQIALDLNNKTLIKKNCTKKICQNKGECFVDENGEEKCNCDQIAFEGKLCETPKCTDDYCLNGGDCKMYNQTRYCDCSKVMFTGSMCEYPKCTPSSCPTYETCIVDYMNNRTICDKTGEYSSKHKECLDFPCQNNGTCKIRYDQPECDCSKTGFTGIFCETPLCQNVNCNHGYCKTTFDSDKKTYCQCIPGYRGKLCEEKYCPDNYCFNGGTCSVRNETVLTCDCQSGYEGRRCEHRKVCGKCDHGYCRRKDNGYECVCENGYQGINCDILKKCPDNYCNGGVCKVKSKDEFECDCSAISRTGLRCEQIQS